MNGINCEYVPEFAKELTWEDRQEALSNQLYVSGEQYFRLCKCNKKVDVVITDSPLPLGLFYNQNPFLDENFEKLILKLFNSFENMNFLLTRNFDYEPNGRNQTKEESDLIGDKIQDFLDRNRIDYIHGISDKKFYDHVINLILKVKK